jgi:hypothetical protein
VNVKLIPSILPNYIPPLADVVSRDSVLRDFDYTVITTYLLEGNTRSQTAVGEDSNLEYE